MSRRERSLHSWQDLAMRRPLPVHFSLFASNRSSSSKAVLCPAWVVRANGVELIRILDPEHKQPFFSLEGIFLLAGLTISEGLLRFKLRRDRGDYDLTLAGLEPREAIWAPWRVTQEIAKELDLYEVLQAFFAERHAWSLDEGVENGITHNWRAIFGSGESGSDDYSLHTLLHRPFTKMSVLPRGQQFRTFVSAEERSRIIEPGKPLVLHPRRSDVAQAASQVEQRLVRWSVLSVEGWREAQEEPHDALEAVTSRDAEMPEAWTASVAEVLLLVSDMLHCVSGASGSKSDRSISMNAGELSISVEEIKRLQLSQNDRTDVRHNPMQSSSVSLFLVNQMFSLYKDAIAVHYEDNEQSNKEEIASNEEHAVPREQLSSDDAGGRGDDSVESYVRQIVQSNERIEAMLKAVLLREQQIRIHPSPSNQNTVAQSLTQSVGPYWVIALIVVSLFNLFQQSSLAS